MIEIQQKNCGYEIYLESLMIDEIKCGVVDNAKCSGWQGIGKI